MSKPNLKNILKTGLSIGSIFTGGKAQSVLEIVNAGILNNEDELNIQPLKDLAEVNDQQNEILIDHERRLRAIEANLNIK